LTQLSEWSENDQERASTWEVQRKVKEAELNGSAKFVVLDARVKELAKEKRDLEQKSRDGFKELPSTVKLEQEIKHLRSKIGVLMSQIREDKKYTNFTEQIKACEQQRRELEAAIRKSAAFKALSMQVDAARVQLQKIEQEVGAKKLSDPAWQRANIALHRLENQRRTFERTEHRNHVGLVRIQSEHRRLRNEQRDLSDELRATEPELSNLDKLLLKKQGVLNTARKRHEDKQRGQGEYIQITKAYAAATKALGDEKKRFLTAAGVSGKNPFARPSAVKHKRFQQSVKYHSTADWDHRTKEEVSGAVPPKMKKWLLRVRGF
jgi:hypothetical protein